MPHIQDQFTGWFITVAKDGGMRRSVSIILKLYIDTQVFNRGEAIGRGCQIACTWSSRSEGHPVVGIFGKELA